jgi:cobalt-zinc-cadmium efflux system protein
MFDYSPTTTFCLSEPIFVILNNMAVVIQLREWFGTLVIPTCFCGIQHDRRAGRSALTLQQRLSMVKTALALLLILFFIQWAIGHWSGSLTLQADAGHLFSDVLALAITFGAICLARRPADDRATFGHQRWEILAALFNSVSLLGISGWIVYESVCRWQAPQDILSGPMLLGALLGLAINGFNLITLSQGDRQDLNLRAAFLHTASDFASSIGAIVAGVSIHLWHCFWIDTCIGLMVAGLTLMSALPLLRESLEVFLEYAPKSVDMTAIRDCLAEFPAIERVETLRVWSLTRESIALCLHLQVRTDLNQVERDRLLKALQNRLRDEFQIQEVIIQISSLPIQALSLPHPLWRQSLAEQMAKPT